MKKLFSIILALALTLCCLAGCGDNKTSSEPDDTTADPSVAEPTTADPYAGLEFSDPSDGTVICTVTAAAPASVTVPAEYQGNAIAGVYCEGKSCADLRELVVEDTGNYLYVDSECFRGCPALESVTFKGNVGGINDGAFQGCPKLKTIVFEKDADDIWNGAFQGCSSLESVTVLGKMYGIRTIETSGDYAGAFQDCTALKTFTVKGEITEICAHSFDNCTSLQTVSISGTVYEIGDAFRNCPNLKEIVLADGSHAANRLTHGIAVGTSEFVELCRTMYAAEIAKQARGVLGTNFDSSKEIDPSSAAEYADDLTLLLYTDQCPDCYPADYSPQQVSEDAELITGDLVFIKENYPGTLLTDEKTSSVKSGKAPVVYALVEAIGTEEVTYHVEGKSSEKKQKKISYRVSIWNEKTNDLLAWFELTDLGYAPESYMTGDKVVFTFSEKSGYFLRDEDGNALTPPFIIEKYVYGADKSIEQED